MTSLLSLFQRGVHVRASGSEYLLAVEIILGLRSLMESVSPMWVTVCQSHNPPHPCGSILPPGALPGPDTAALWWALVLPDTPEQGIISLDLMLRQRATCLSSVRR